MLEYEPQECTGKCYIKLIQIRIVRGEKPKLHTSHILYHGLVSTLVCHHHKSGYANVQLL